MDLHGSAAWIHCMASRVQLLWKQGSRPDHRNKHHQVTILGELLPFLTTTLPPALPLCGLNSKAGGAQRQSRAQKEVHEAVLVLNQQDESEVPELTWQQ